MKKIIVVTHERSGTHLVINTINFENNGNFIPLGKLPKCPVGEKYSLYNYMDKVNVDLENGIGGNEIIVKSHHQIEFFEDLPKLFEEYKVIYVMRDIKDVLVSYYKFLNGYGFDSNGNTIPIKGFPEFKDWIFMKPDDIGMKYFETMADPHIFIEPDSYIDRWKIHVQGWKEVKDQILIVMYENLLTNFSETKNKIEEFIGKKIAEQIPNKRNKKLPNFGPNKGVIGSHLDYMDENLADKINTMSRIE